MALSNSMVCHRWAHGNAGKSENMSTDGKRLISYATDIGYNAGRGLLFLLNDSMSSSTGKQLRHARSACSHLDRIYTPIFHYGGRLYDFDEKQAFNLACEALNVTLEGYSKAKLGKYLSSSIRRAYELAAELNGYAVKYGFDVHAFHQVSEEKREAARLYADQWDAKDATRREAACVKEFARQAAQRLKDEADFTAWRAGAGRCPHSYRLDADGGYYIAVHGDKVVTSGCAECPLDHARRGIEFWFSRDNNDGTFNPWHHNGQRIQLGMFQLNRIEADGTAYAGCHKFSLAELNRLADILL